MIELLIVITIIAILASLLTPALIGVKSRMKNIACANNLKQWGLATALYASENGDDLPPEGISNPTPRSTNSGWYVQLPRQLNLPPYHEMPWRTNATTPAGRSIWICPDNVRRSNGRNLFHYCLNEHVNGTGRATRPVKLASVSNPSVVPWLFDSKNLPAVGYWGFVHTNLHNQSAQFLFLDGRVQRYPNSAYWDFGTDRGRTNNPELLWIP